MTVTGAIIDLIATIDLIASGGSGRWCENCEFILKKEECVSKSHKNEGLFIKKHPKTRDCVLTLMDSAGRGWGTPATVRAILTHLMFGTFLSILCLVLGLGLGADLDSFAVDLPQVALGGDTGVNKWGTAVNQHVGEQVGHRGESARW